MPVHCCPNCGHEQVRTDECAKCGVIISKFTEIKKRPKSNQREIFNKSTEQKPKKLIYRIIKWTFWSIVFLFIGAMAAFVYIGNQLTDMHVIHSTTEGYCSSFSRKFPEMCVETGTCCYECIIDVIQSGDYTESELEVLFQEIFPPDEIRDLGFLIAKNVNISNGAEIPILVCKTPIEPVRPQYGGPPGKDHLVVFSDVAFSWMRPSDYEALDKSPYVDIEVLIKKFRKE